MWLSMDSRTVARQTVRGSFFSVGGSAITLSSGFIRAILLARLLTPEDFGAFTLAVFFLSVVGQLNSLGFDVALVHRQDNLPKAYSTHFVLRSLLGVLFFLVCLGLAPYLGRLYPSMPDLRPIFLALAVLEVIRAINRTPLTVLSKELCFRQIAILDIAASLSMTVVAPLVAWSGFGFWALVAEQVTGECVRTIGLWVVYRPWKLDLRFDRELARSYFQFGSKIVASRGIDLALARFDDFWIGTMLGAGALGFYNRTFEFAGYCRRVVAKPVMNVLFPVFATVQDNRLLLSKAFYRTASIVIRAGFLFAGVFMFIAPEFIAFFLGEKWVPMTLTFQLMLIYMMFDPLGAAVGHLMNAIGRPGITVRIKFIQLILFLPAVVIGARYWGIEGVAVAADLLVLTGVFLYLGQVRRFVDFSAARLFTVPMVGIILGSGVTVFTAHLLQGSHDLVLMLGKILSI
jgi:PST family polysaccharide transporter